MTLCIIKPHAVRDGAASAIEMRIHEHGFTLLARMEVRALERPTGAAPSPSPSHCARAMPITMRPGHDQWPCRSRSLTTARCTRVCGRARSADGADALTGG